MDSMRRVSAEEVEDLIWECSACGIRPDELGRPQWCRTRPVSELLSSRERGCQRCKVYLRATDEFHPGWEALTGLSLIWKPYRLGNQPTAFTTYSTGQPNLDGMSSVLLD